MKKLVLFAGIAAGFLVATTAHAHQIERQIECVGVLTSRPVHIHDIEGLEYGHGNLVFDDGRKQSTRCDWWFEGKTWKKVNDACQDDKLCRLLA